MSNSAFSIWKLLYWNFLNRVYWNLKIFQPEKEKKIRKLEVGDILHMCVYSNTVYWSQGRKLKYPEERRICMFSMKELETV